MYPRMGGRSLWKCLPRWFPWEWLPTRVHVSERSHVWSCDRRMPLYTRWYSLCFYDTFKDVYYFDVSLAMFFQRCILTLMLCRYLPNTCMTFMVHDVIRPVISFQEPSQLPGESGPTAHATLYEAQRAKIKHRNYLCLTGPQLYSRVKRSNYS